MSSKQRHTAAQDCGSVASQTKPLGGERHDTSWETLEPIGGVSHFALDAARVVKPGDGELNWAVL